MSDDRPRDDRGAEGWPHATKGGPLPGALAGHHEDFEVEEIPAYEPQGTGDHTYFFIEKRGLSSRRAAREITRALEVSPRQLGMAGQKDAHAVTRQWMSLEHVDPARVRDLSLPRIRVLEVSRHRNKLRMGHLKGNRFRLKLRGADLARVDEYEEVLAVLAARGVPNYFAEQRFGNRGDTWRVGQALLEGDFARAAGLVAGEPGPLDSGDVERARGLYEAGDYRGAAAAWPRGFDECVAVCQGMERHGGDHRRAVLGVGKRSLGFYISACQAWLFNQVLAARIAGYDQVLEGDVAWKHVNGAAFLVDDAETEAARASSFEISAAGPLFGPKMKPNGGVPAEIEARVLDGSGLSAESFGGKGPLRVPGGRRPLRFPPEEVAVTAASDEHGDYLGVGFALPAGCYATAVLRELLKGGGSPTGHHT